MTDQRENWAERHKNAVVIFITCLIIGNAFFTVVLFKKVYEQSDNNKNVVCALRLEYTKRITNTQRFLDTHPGKEPFPGITRATLTKQITDLQGTVNAFRFVECPGEN